MKYPAWVIVLSVCIVGVAAWIGPAWWRQREWLQLQAQQMATIERFGQFPPPGVDSTSWSNQLITVHNVWGNVKYAPHYSGISNAAMRDLLGKLRQLLTETTPENSAEHIDRVFGLLLERGQKMDFITGYRDEFRASYLDAVK